MKTNENPSKPKTKYVAIMLLCFVYGGFSLVSFLLQAYTAVWQTDIAGFPFIESRIARMERGPDDFNRVFPSDANRFAAAMQSRPEPLALLLSPVALYWLIGGLVSIFAGFAVWSLIREKEIKQIKLETANNLLLPDERKIIDALKGSNYEMTQAKLAKETGLGKVQVHRTVKRLESKGVLEKHGYGLTNKIILKREVFE